MNKSADNTALFSGKSNFYAASRPTYPAQAIQWLRNNTAAQSVVDIGAGTGIFTELLLPHFQNVCAVEPNKDMSDKFREALPEVPIYSTTGENTGLLPASVELITIAQAFHWLDEERFKAEAMRILAPGGQVAIIWNNRTSEGIAPVRDAICQKYCPRFSKGHAGKRSPAEGDHFLRYEYFKSVKYFSCPNLFYMDQEQFISNVRSRSYALTEADEKFDEFMQEINAVYRDFSENGVVCEVYNTEIFLGEF